NRERHACHRIASFTTGPRTWQQGRRSARSPSSLLVMCTKSDTIYHQTLEWQTLEWRELSTIKLMAKGDHQCMGNQGVHHLVPPTRHPHQTQRPNHRDCTCRTCSGCGLTREWA